MKASEKTISAVTPATSGSSIHLRRSSTFCAPRALQARIISIEALFQLRQQRRNAESSALPLAAFLAASKEGMNNVQSKPRKHSKPRKIFCWPNVLGFLQRHSLLSLRRSARTCFGLAGRAGCLSSCCWS